MNRRRYLGMWSGLVILLTFHLGASGALAALDMFLKIEGIEGESTDPSHAGEIEVLAWSWGLSNTPGGTGKANFQDISFTKYIDKSSPKLMLACASGQQIPKATLVVRKPTVPPLEYVQIELENVIITSCSAGGSGGEDRLTENVTLNFTKVSQTYRLPTGEEISVGWDLEANVPLPTPPPTALMVE